MHFSSLSQTSWALMVSLTIIGNALPSHAQTSPATTYQPGSWQPVARVDPAKPIQLSISNQSGSTLEYGLTTRKRLAKEILPGETAVIKEVVLPAYLNISVPSRPPFSELALKYNLKADNNSLVITVKLKDDIEGDRVIDINEKGAVYIY